MSAADLVATDGAVEVGTCRLCACRRGAGPAEQNAGRKQRGHHENSHRRVVLAGDQRHRRRHRHISASVRGASPRRPTNECHCTACGPGPDPGDDHRDPLRPAQPQPQPQRVGVDVDTANQDLDRTHVARRKRLTQAPFAVAQLARAPRIPARRRAAGRPTGRRCRGRAATVRAAPRSGAPGRPAPPRRRGRRSSDPRARPGSRRVRRR